MGPNLWRWLSTHFHTCILVVVVALNQDWFVLEYPSSLNLQIHGLSWDMFCSDFVHLDQVQGSETLPHCLSLLEYSIQQKNSLGLDQGWLCENSCKEYSLPPNIFEKLYYGFWHQSEKQKILPHWKVVIFLPGTVSHFSCSTLYCKIVSILHGLDTVALFQAPLSQLIV